MNQFKPTSLAALACAAFLAGCATGTSPAPPPPIDLPLVYKEAATSVLWQPAVPADTADRGAWWTLFGDPQLDALARDVEVSNQNLAAAVAAYFQADALVRQQRAALFPSADLTGGATRSRSGAASSGTGSASSRTSLQLGLGAGWEPDLWGRLRDTVGRAAATAQASEADLANARLSATAALASNYFSLRGADAQIALLQASVEGYERSLEITRNRYEAGIIAQTDVLQAQTQLATTRADLAATVQSRAQLEHAIAVLTGRAPGNFTLEAVPQWQVRVVDVPPGLPSTLLQRRPDIAAAERTVAAANLQIGIQRTAYYPSFTLSGSLGQSATRVGDLFSTAATVWSLGLSAAQVIFDAGAIRAAVEAAEAGRDIAAANYRQTVLNALQDVEDQLSAAGGLAEQEGFRREASAAADRTEQQILNRYRAGQVGYTEVVTAQASALAARRTLLQVQINRQTAAVALVQALGGGWQAPWATP